MGRRRSRILGLSFRVLEWTRERAALHLHSDSPYKSPHRPQFRPITMGKRQLQVATSDDEDDEPKHADKKQKLKADSKKQPDAEEEKGEEEEEVPPEDAKPVGDVIKSVGKGKKRRKHYNSFEYEGNVYEIEDPVLITPEDKPQKPYVAIIKEITQEVSGNMMITGQWFYRPEEAEKKGGGTWQGRDTRELFYSFHLDEVPAESVMHKCVVHFIPLNKKIPRRQQHPGFVVQKVYDAVEKRLWKLTDKDYEDVKQQEIDVLVQKTIKRIGELENIEPENISADNKDQTTSKRSLRKKNMPPIDVSKNDDTTTKLDHPMKAETPGSCTTDVSEYRLILSNLNALTGDSYRDKWLDKLLEGIQTACNPNQEALTDDKKGNLATSDLTNNGNAGASTVIEPKENNSEASEDVSRGLWPDAAVQAITALEKASHDALGSDFQKYNKKMRQLVFNLKNSVALSRRLLNKELDPVVIVNMSPNELKDGLTAEEKTTKEPEESKRVQMTDARCSRCTEKKVCVAEIIHASHGDRYQLECMACGYTWYASHDAISSLTIDTPSAAGNVGTAPWATAKFEDVERKKLVSPRESEKPDVDIFQKSTAAYMPVLEAQKSLNKSKSDDPPVSAVSHND